MIRTLLTALGNAPVLDDVIDVSDAQGLIDWPTVYRIGGIRFAFVKATEGRSFAAHNFTRNMAGAKAAGITTCPYDFLRPGYEQDQFNFFVMTAGLAMNVLTMLDWEGRAADTCSPQDYTIIGQSIITVTGRPPVGYFGKLGSTPQPPTQIMQTWPRDVPRYLREPCRSWSDVPLIARLQPLHYWSGALFAQYSRTGVVPGIIGPVDRSVFIGTQAERTAWIENGTMPKR